MTTNKSLAAAFATEPTAPQAVATPQPAEPLPARKAVIVRMSREAHRALRVLGLDLDRSVQSLMMEGLNHVLQKNGRPPVA